MIHARQHPGLVDIAGLHDLVDGVHRPGGNAARQQALEPLVPGPGPEPRGEAGDQLLAARDALRIGGPSAASSRASQKAAQNLLLGTQTFR